MPTLAAFNDAPSHARRQRAQMEGQGYYAETFPRNATANSSALATGILYATGIGLLAGDVVTNLGVHVATVGATLTLVKFAVLDKNGNRLAVSADVKADMLSTGAKTVPMGLQANGTPLVIPADDLYYVAALSVGTTGPALLRSLSIGTDSRIFSSAFGNVGFVSAQADIQSSNTLVFTGATTMLQIWSAVA